MNTQEEATALFQKYRDTLNDEFLTQEEAQDADTAAKIFLGKLDELGFMVASHVSSALSYERVENGETITVITHFFDLSLVPKGTPLIQTEVAVKRITAMEAVAKVYSPLPAVPPPREDEWNFTEKERHAFLCALKRHGERLIQSCEKNNTPFSPDDWETILTYVGAMTIGIGDAFILSCLLEAEIPFLEAYRGANELGGCPCQAGEHVDALVAWKRRNIQMR